MSKQEGLLPRQGGHSEYGTRWPVSWNGFRLSNRRWLTLLSSTAALCKHCGCNGCKRAGSTQSAWEHAPLPITDMALYPERTGRRLLGVGGVNVREYWVLSAGGSTEPGRNRSRRDTSSYAKGNRIAGSLSAGWERGESDLAASNTACSVRGLLAGWLPMTSLLGPGGPGHRGRERTACGAEPWGPHKHPPGEESVPPARNPAACLEAYTESRICLDLSFPADKTKKEKKENCFLTLLPLSQGWHTDKSLWTFRWKVLYKLQVSSTVIVTVIILMIIMMIMGGGGTWGGTKPTLRQRKKPFH